MEFVAGEFIEALGFIKLALLAPFQIFQFGDDPIELALEQLGVLVAGEHKNGDCL